MDKYDYSDFDWHMYPEHVYDIDFRQKMVSEFKIEKSLALECFSRLEKAVINFSRRLYDWNETPIRKGGSGNLECCFRRRNESIA
jgi:hypothetical protein